MTMQRVIKLGERLLDKYAQPLSVQEEIDIHDALEVLEPISVSQLQFGANKAARIMSHLNDKLRGTMTQPANFADASYMDNIIGNMVYSRIPDDTIMHNANIIMDALKDQNLETTGSFTRAFIPSTIARYKEALRIHNNDSVAAAKWSKDMPAATREAYAKQLKEEKEKQERLLAYRAQQNKPGS